MNQPLVAFNMGGSRSSIEFIDICMGNLLYINPEPDLRSFWGDSLTKPPFGVTSAEVVLNCPDIVLLGGASQNLQVVSSHDDGFRPLRIGLWDMAFFGLYMGLILTT